MQYNSMEAGPEYCENYTMQIMQPSTAALRMQQGHALLLEFVFPESIPCFKYEMAVVIIIVNLATYLAATVNIVKLSWRIIAFHSTPRNALQIWQLCTLLPWMALT